MTPEQLTGIPKAAIVILEQPKEGSFTLNQDLTVVYTAPAVAEGTFFAQPLVYVYKDLNGELVEARREFVVVQEGDVPSLIQTGYRDQDAKNATNPWKLTALGIAAWVFFFMFFRRPEDESNG